MKFNKCTICLLGLAATAHVNARNESICLGDCEKDGDSKICRFTMKVNLYAGELGYYTIDECGDEINPTIGIEKDVTNVFLQEVSYITLLSFMCVSDSHLFQG